MVKVLADREWAVGVVRTVRGNGKSRIEIFDEFGEIGIALLGVGNVTQAHFFHEAILERLISALDPSFGLRRIGAQQLNLKLLHRPPELGLGIPFFTASLVDTEDTVFVAVEG